ncbi:carboxypeptidase-like regulatory domain-containing protein [Carboxylicivirga sp. A043]|uniref:carboxypeptidase-like regulatory domain-containing protein n=1 Tax=Carboxylicivirga litoralis TaxID=2816963 RepID=UPI0021CB5075|nr:carboxypeptidase-like regulatory domain-containing protein [Carboxylicivirga sp. A043]MCU4156048.1 carboxypeptidase-like regulatory domain-containing protein [Carboxylicivirga sp. A043]
MRTTFLLLTYLFICIFNTEAQKTTHFYLDSVAQANQLELCFSEDMVNLQRTIYPPKDSLPLDDYLKRLAYESHLDIQLKGSNLIVTNPNEQTILVSGRLRDLNSNEPLPFAHILQRDWGTGSITNAEGGFELHVPSVLSGLPLEFSCMGYSDTTIIIPQGDSLNLNIALRPKPYNLNEVLVLPNGNTAEDLVRMACKRIKRNYHRKTAQMDAFYRRTGFRDSTFVQLIEAALLVEDKGIDMPSSTTKIKIREIRKSQNYLVPMDAKYKWAFERTEKYLFGGHRNMFYRAIGNPVRTYKADWWFRPLVDYNTFKYEFEGAMWLDSTKVYKVKYEYDALYPNGKRASEVGDDFFGGYIYINASDYGILKMNRVEEYYGDDKQKQVFRIGNKTLWDNEYSFQQINGKYYLKYIKDLDWSRAKSFIYENPDADDKDKKVKSRQWAEQLLVITNVVTERQQRERIRQKELLDRHENSYETNYPYNPEFWENYSMIKQKPLPGKAIEDLEWEKSLEIQFEENSTANVED